MNSIIERIRAKITRAKQHVQDFEQAVRAYNDTNPYEVSIKEDTQVGKRFYYVSKVSSLPDSVATIAADVIQNLRSPLDQIAYQFVLDARGGSEPDWSVYYPISRSAKDYPARSRGMIKGVGKVVIDAIDATQPYKGGKGHVLWQLNELNNPDKHKLLITAGAFSDGVSHSPDLTFLRDRLPASELVGLDEPMYFIRPASNFFSLKMGDNLYTEPIHCEVDKKRLFKFNVSFDAPGVIECEPALKTLQDMTNFVDDVIAKLGRLLP